MVGSKLLCSIIQMAPKIPYTDIENFVKGQRNSKSKFPSMKIRIFEMRKKGTIKNPSRKIIFDNKKLGINILYCYIQVNSIIKKELCELEDFLKSFDEIRLCSKIIDDVYNYSIIISYTTTDHKNLVLRRLSEYGNIKSTLICDEISNRIEKTNIPITY